MAKLEHKDLLDAGVHFGHLTRKWDPKMAPYIFMEKNGIHIIDLHKSLECLEEASNALKSVVRSGRKIMFVATKKQAKEIVAAEAQRLNMPFVTERWLGGMLTNFATIRKSLKKMSSIEKLMKEDQYTNLAKRERLMVSREKAKLERVLGGISELTRLPAALFVIDVKREHIAVKEAKKLNIPVYAMIRPRDGDFLYSSYEIEMMLADIHSAKAIGAQGVVFGLLNTKAEIDNDTLKSLMQASKGLGVTFHRAIDCCLDAGLAVETILSAGCDRILTSGLASTAELGADCIKSMVEQSRGRLSIMAGAGINASNVACIVKATGVQEVHLSGKVSRASQMQTVTNCGLLPEFKNINVTGSGKIDELKKALQGF